MRVPIISIALPFFNAEATLASSVQSIIKQNFTDWELLLLDDGSSDASLSIARAFDDPRIRVFSDGQNLGISSRLNQGIALAYGKYFFRMDSDDLAFPGRLQIQHDFLEAHPDIDLVASNVILFRSDGEILGSLEVVAEHADIVARPCAGFYMPHPTWGGRTSWFSQHLYKSVYNGAEDHELLYRTHRSSRFACITTPLLAYREVGQGLGKRFGRRKILARAMFQSACHQRCWGDMICVVFCFLFKSAIDLICHVLRLPGLRVRFARVSAEQMEEVKRLLRAEA